MSRKHAYHCGWKAGIFAIAYASRQGAHSNTWFIDVEKGESVPWSSKNSLNSSFLRGMASALGKGGETVGFYTTSSHWEEITGGWRSGGPGWIAVGTEGRPSSSLKKQKCGYKFTGHKTVYYQWIVGGWSRGLDHNDYC